MRWRQRERLHQPWQDVLEWLGVAKDEARAFALYKQACDGGNTSSCIDVGGMCAKGTGVAKDEARAFGLYKQVCDGGNMYGCALVGTSYVNGTGVEKDEAHGLALLQQMCDGGKMDGCTALGSIWVMKDEARGVAFYKQACDSGSKGGCSSIETLGMMYALNNNRARADELFRLLPPQRSPSTPVTAPVTLPVIDPSNKRIGFTLVTDFKNKAPRANVEIFFAYYEPKSKSWEKSNQRSGADGNCVFGVPAGRKGESNTFVWASTAKDLDDRMSAVADGKFLASRIPPNPKQQELDLQIDGEGHQLITKGNVQMWGLK